MEGVHTPAPPAADNLQGRQSGPPAQSSAPSLPTTIAHPAGSYPTTPIATQQDRHQNADSQGPAPQQQQSISTPSPMTGGMPYNTPLRMPQNNNMMNAGQINTQIKRPIEDMYAPQIKRPKVDGPATPGLMGPPTSMGPPGMMQKKKDQGLDEGDPNDVFGGAGINLQDEERNMTTFEVPNRNAVPFGMQVYGQQRDMTDRARRSDFLHPQALDYLLQRKLAENALVRCEPEVSSLISLATKDRLSGLLGQMIVLAKHRCAPPPKNGRPIDDVGSVLKSISLAEAQDEDRRRTIAAARRAEEEAKRREADEAASSIKKKTGTTKTLTEQTIARNANATAQMMLNQSGGKKYSWMTGSPNTSQLSRRTTVQAFNGIQPNVFKTGAEEHASLITLKDFCGALELEGGDIVGRGGKALLRAYTQWKD